jgi:putative effector of murein hydrolase
MSLIEAISNVAVGFLVALLTQVIVFPLFGLQASFADNLALGSIFTGISIARSYLLRRLFEAIRVRSVTSNGVRSDKDPCIAG